MNDMIRRVRFDLIAAALLSCMACGVEAQNTQGDSALRYGGYIAPMATYLKGLDHSRIDDGYGGTLGVGYRRDWWALQVAGAYSVMSASGSGGGSDPKFKGVVADVLLFPFESLPNSYGVLGVGAREVENYPAAAAKSLGIATVDGGIGQLFPLRMGRYEFALRGEALVRYGRRDVDQNVSQVDVDAPKNFADLVLNVGLHFPLGLLPPPAPPPQPVRVEAPVNICSDGQDNDGDGEIDFPNDPGCSAADDGDETDPPVCSDGKDNDGDGLIDFPSDKGCAAADDTDEVDPCKTPAPGERISLKGCGTGDIIVLRGVNFEFDKARLTANAKTILDNVAEELTAYPEIEVELGGHTDAKGSDEYNQVLSDKRAASVKRYLVGKDIADSRMTTVGMGEAQPVADNETDEGRELNRRVELKVTKGVAPGGPAVMTEAKNPEATAADVPDAEADDVTDGATPDAAAAPVVP